MNLEYRHGNNAMVVPGRTHAMDIDGDPRTASFDK